MHKLGSLSVLFVITFLTQTSSSVARGQPASLDAAKRFVGTWRLISIVSNGQMDSNRGPHPTGVIYYDGVGNMALQIMPDRVRPKYAASPLTPEEAKAVLTGYSAYFGTYTVKEDARTVTHHIKGSINPGQLGDGVRQYEFAPDERLILGPVGNPTSRLTWERMR
jgi:hypothetical protein